MESLSQKIAIVFPSCDKYSDLWDALFATIFLRWKECPFEFYLVSNNIECENIRVNTIKIGEDKTWCLNLVNALQYVPQSYILLFIDDLFISKNIDHNKVIALMQRCVDNSWNYLRLNPTPGAEKCNYIDGEVGNIKAGDWYRASTVFSLWKKSVLLDILQPNENAWELEIFGSQRTDKYCDWYASNFWLLPYENLVVKGKIVPAVYRMISDTGISLKSDRPVMTVPELVILRIKYFRTKLMNLIPRSYRRRLRSFFSAA